MHDTLLRNVDNGRPPGLVVLISRRGAEHVDAIGTLAFDRTAPMRRDTIFRLASVTNPITAVASMILVKECRLRLVRVDPLFNPNPPSRASGGRATFEPGARTAWHTHPLGQTLIVTAGSGRVQQWGGPIQDQCVVSLPSLIH